jgi:hypothetical protein
MSNGMLLPFYTLQRLRMALNGGELFRFSLSLFRSFLFSLVFFLEWVAQLVAVLAGFFKQETL